MRYKTSFLVWRHIDSLSFGYAREDRCVFVHAWPLIEQQILWLRKACQIDGQRGSQSLTMPGMRILGAFAWFDRRRYEKALEMDIIPGGIEPARWWDGDR